MADRVADTLADRDTVPGPGTRGDGDATTPRKRPRMSRRAFLVRGAGLFSGALALDAFALEPGWLALERVEVPIRHLPAPFDGYRIGFLADFHYPRWISVDFIRKALSLARDFRPHLLLLGGDFLDEAATATVPDVEPILGIPRPPDGVWGVLGNHDHLVDARELREGLRRQTPVRLIENRWVAIRRGGAAIALAGLGDLWYGKVDPAAALGSIPPAMPRLLLSHNPDIAETLPPEMRVDLQLSGHTHGGQVRIPFGPAPLVPSRYGNKYRAGLVEGPHHRVYVTRGVGGLLPIRFCCRPEVTGIILRRA